MWFIPPKPNFWKLKTIESKKWNDPTSETFKSVINNYLIGDLEKEVLMFIEHIAKAKQLIKKTKKAKHTNY